MHFPNSYCDDLPNEHQIYIKDPKLESIMDFNVEKIKEDPSILVIDPLKVEPNSIAYVSLNNKSLDRLLGNNVSQEYKKLQDKSNKHTNVKESKESNYVCKNEEYICDTCEIVFWDFEKITQVYKS